MTIPKILRWMAIVTFLALCALKGFAFYETSRFDLLQRAFLSLITAFAFFRQEAQATVDTKLTAVAITILHLSLPIVIPGIGNALLPKTGLVISSVGIFIATISIVDLKKSFGVIPALRSVETDGMYKYVRHPIYTGYLISFIGFILINCSVATVLALVLFCFLTHYRILKEEQVLTQDLRYINYQEAVKYRLLPGVY